MSVARHHAEWLSLIEVSGPFVSMPVLMRVFPQGLDPRDSELARETKVAYEEWLEKPDAAGRHRSWITFVLARLLGFPNTVLTEGQAIPSGMKASMPEYGELLQPDMVVIGPSGTPYENKVQLLVQIHAPDQKLDSPVGGKLWKASPSTRMMELLHATDVSLGLVTNGEQWMLVFAPRGETTGYASWFSGLWLEEAITLRAFHSLLTCRRFFGVAENETLLGILRESAKDQQEVTDQLGYQVRRAVEVLVWAIDRIDIESGRTILKDLGEKNLYDAALTVMMRLVFLFSAEERDLLLLGDLRYDDNYAVSTLREQLREAADQLGEEVLERRHDAWVRLLAVFRAVHGGVEHESLRLPAYGGTLFDPDRYPFLEGRPRGSQWRTTPADPLQINNRVVLHLLESLQILQVKVPGGGPAEARRLSFRALDIEQIGHVYEGLLDHTAVRAPSVVLGLRGSKDNEPEITLEVLESLRAAGIEKLVEFLHDQTDRSPNSLQKSLSEPELTDERKFRMACGSDRGLFDRIRPFASLIRMDSFDMPVIIPAGSVFVTRGSTRRSTGTHYTPRCLTEPIVQHTLEPLVYEGPAEGWSKDKWKLKSPRAILELKVCDMAMGSGAFLVQACRYMSERLVEAWEILEKANPGRFLATPEGDLATGSTSERLIPADPAERLALARRAVVDRCLYGVDINPMAVEMAKLSLWLVTLQKDRPFTFLDHALKCGDSLLGISSFDQLEKFSLHPEKAAMVFSALNLFRHIEDAADKRRRLEALSSDQYSDIQTKTTLYTEAETAVAKLKYAADLLIAVELQGLPAKEYNTAREEMAGQMMHYWSNKSLDEFRHLAFEQLHGRRTFHWPVEFPEVFARGGFDVFIGNPPFRGGLMITKDFDIGYTLFLKAIISNAGATTDLCAYFFRRAFDLLREHGVFGLLATNSICEGDTRETSLEYILKNGGSVCYAIRSLPWPGIAALHVAVVHIVRGQWSGTKLLDGEPVDTISSSLLLSRSLGHPRRLADIIPAFLGTTVYGKGFFLTPNEAQRLISQDQGCKSVIKRFLNGDDVMQSPIPLPSRFVLYFQGKTEDEAAQFAPAFALAKERAYPERQKSGSKRRREMWWLYTSPADDLYETIKPLRFVFVTCFVSKYIVFTKMESDMIFSNTVIVISSDDFGCFALLQSSYHEAWVQEYSSTLETRQRYALSDCYETFPQTHITENIRAVGVKYHKHREKLMIKDNIGLTDLYNRFHKINEMSVDIVQLRSLHVEMDQAVAATYGWNDLDLGHGFHETKQGLRYTISESARRTVLDRLLALNHQRNEEEVKAGLHDKNKKKSPAKGSCRRSKGDSSDSQKTLF